MILTIQQANTITNGLVYTIQKWRKGRTNPYDDSYQPNVTHFAPSLIQIKGDCWTPPVDYWINPLLYCIEYERRGPQKFEAWKNKDLELYFKNKLPWLSSLIIFSPDDIFWITHVYKIQLHVYSNREIHMEDGVIKKACGREIFLFKEFGDESRPHKMAVYYDEYRTHPGQSWLLLHPDKEGHLSFLDKKRCHCCGKWIKKAYNEHIRNCRKCECGTAYHKDSDHALHCNKPNYKTKGRAEICRLYKAEEGEFNLSNCFFADFETLINEKQVHVPYACHYANHKDAFSHHLWYGRNSLDRFMRNVLENVNGIMWFYNGGRFDCFFIIKWCIQNKILLDERMLVSGTDIISFAIPTKRGQVVFKDLYKFMMFGLDQSCKDFGLAKHLQKGHIDHSKMISFEAAEEHKMEVCQYLRQDVIALRALYEAYAKACWDNYRLNPAKAMTKSQLAYMAWTSLVQKLTEEGKLEPIELIRTKKEHEPMNRMLYKGGRVLCGRPHWQCHNYDSILEETMPLPHQNKNEEGETTFWESWGDVVDKEVWDNQEDYAYYIDCNSLYPAAQKGRNYPHGKCKMKAIERDSEDELKLIESLNERPEWLTWKSSWKKERKRHIPTKITWKEFWAVSAAKVDVICPKDLSIGFLMSRNEEGVTQDLEDKKEYWYTGPELWEASKLGYIITRVHYTMTWSKQAKMFDQWVDIVYKRKSTNDGNKSLRAEAKLALNALTGKFGQIGVDEVMRFFPAGEEIDKSVSNLSCIEDENGKLIGWFGTVIVTRDYSPYPIHLSAFILGNSKVIMSRVIRKMTPLQKQPGETQEEKAIRMKGGYLEYEYAPYYGDTDSLILHKKMYDLLPEEYKGKELGKFKDEMENDHYGNRNCKIISITVLSPKNYLINYIADKSTQDKDGNWHYQYQLKSTFKAKGIPHSTDEYNTKDTYKVPDHFEAKTKEIAEYIQKRRAKKEETLPYASSVDIKSRAYVFRKIIPKLDRNGKEVVNKSGNKVTEAGKIIHVASRIPPTFIPRVVSGELALEAYFGCMVRVFGHGRQIYIANDYKVRTVNKNNWWKKGHRICLPPTKENPFPTALPLGHELVKEESQQIRDSQKEKEVQMEIWRGKKQKRDETLQELYFQGEEWVPLEFE